MLPSLCPVDFSPSQARLGLSAISGGGWVSPSQTLASLDHLGRFWVSHSFSFTRAPPPPDSPFASAKTPIFY